MFNEEFKELCYNLGFGDEYRAVISGRFSFQELLVLVVIEQQKRITNLEDKTCHLTP